MVTYLPRSISTPELNVRPVNRSKNCPAVKLKNTGILGCSNCNSG